MSESNESYIMLKEDEHRVQWCLLSSRGQHSPPAALTALLMRKKEAEALHELFSNVEVNPGLFPVV